MELTKVKLKKLLQDLPVKIMGNKELEVTGLSAHSKRVVPGHLFIAKGGLKTHGSHYIEEAIRGGAKAILTDLFDPFCKDVTQIICPDPALLEGELASRFYHYPAQDLFLVGITGTNGKTTTSYLIRTLMGEMECGLIGTIEYIIGDNYLPATHTTPDVITNQNLLSRMKTFGLSRCVMEVTSHGLAQNRVDHIPFDLAVFTNLSQDHLDYHKSFEEYLKVKSKLFEGLAPDKTALINIDSEYASKITENCKATIKTYGIHKDADYRAINVKLKPANTTFELICSQGQFSIKTHLVGEFNVYNILAAVSVALEAGIEIDLVLERLKKFKAPKGRLQAIPNKLKAQIFVDFAHTEDALKNVLETLKQIPHRHLITVFGCGGDRDQEKRPLMGKVVSSLSDLTIITSDNPRSEDPEQICKEIYKGCEDPSKVLVEVCRKTAIEKAIKRIQPKDILLVAGRGHETHQIIGHSRIPFDDAEVVADCLKN